jgi:RNA polymerase sigma factor (sigma-70 family)
VEASAIPAKVGLGRTRIAIGGPLLRLRSDEQLVTLFRAGSDEAFRAIHDRYRTRLYAYTRQMLAGSAADAEDAVQEIFVRAYAGLRANHRELALRAWLYRIAHNRCVDELRRPQTMPTDELPAMAAGHGFDPVAQMEQRDVLRRLIADVQRLPDQQRSALLMRELGGMTYADVSGALGVSVPAVKSLLVRARVGLAQANEARDTACERIREDLIVSHDRGVRTSGLARRHMRDCPSCRQFRSEVRGVSRQLAAFAPALGPAGVIAKLLGIGGAGGGGAAASSGAVAGGGAAAVGTGAAASAGAIAGASHVVTIIAAAVVTAGGAYELQHISPPPLARAAHHHVAPARAAGGAASPAAQPGGAPAADVNLTSSATSQSASGSTTGATGSPAPLDEDAVTGSTLPQRLNAAQSASSMPLPETVDPDNLSYVLAHSRSTADQAPGAAGSAATGLTTSTPATSGSGSATATPTSTGSAAGQTSSSTTSTGTGTVTGTATASTGETGSGPASTAAASTAAGSGSASSTAPASTGTASSPSSASAGTSGGAASSSAAARPVVKMTPAATSGPITTRPGRVKTAGKGHGTVAIFTMTGN